MKFKYKEVIVFFVFLILTFSLTSYSLEPSSENFNMPLSTVDSAGGESGCENFNLNSSAGQSTPIGKSESERNIIHAGFQQPDAPTPTLITLSSFNANYKDGKVILLWKTGTEVENIGFNILRSKIENDEYVKINKKLIPAKGTATKGESYRFADEKVKPGKTYYYKLEDIDRKVGSTFHGPVSVTVNFKKKK